MNRLIDRFIRAKHWEIFLLFVVLFGAGSLVITTSDKMQPPAFFALAVIAEVCFLAWFWSMGSFLSSIVEPRLRLNLGFFRLALLYPPVYVFAFLALFENTHFEKLLPILFVVILPMHLFAMFCMLYTLYFVSKSLVLAETGQSISFRKYAGSLLLIWFFPIGVWTVQPRLNRLYAGSRALLM